MRELNEALARLGETARWLERGAGPLTLRDHVLITGLSRPLWLVWAGAGERLYFVALAEYDGAWCDATGHALFQREALPWLSELGALATAGGHRVHYDGAPLGACEIVQADSGGSSNCVTRIEVGSVQLMHKAYRQLVLENLEAVASERLGQPGLGLLPGHAGSYRYCLSDGRQYALGLVTEFFAGQGLHAELSANLRALWTKVPAAPDVAERHSGGLLAELKQWRIFLNRFHAEMTQQFVPGAAMPRFDLAGYCAQERTRLARLQRLVLDDQLLPAPLAQRLARILAALGRGYFEDDGSALPASLCHGDLHLSHLMWRRKDGVEQRRLIDVSPPALAADDPQLRHSSHLLDWAAVARALDYFCLDEAALELAPHTGLSQEECMRQLALARLDETAMPGGEPVAQRLAALAKWQAEVRAALCGTAQPGQERAQLRFYCARLLQELDYNYRYRRPYYRCMDLYCLAQHFLFLDGG